MWLLTFPGLPCYQGCRKQSADRQALGGQVAKNLRVYHTFGFNFSSSQEMLSLHFTFKLGVTINLLSSMGSLAIQNALMVPDLGKSGHCRGSIVLITYHYTDLLHTESQLWHSGSTTHVACLGNLAVLKPLLTEHKSYACRLMYVCTLPDFTAAIQSGNKTTQKSNFSWLKFCWEWSGHGQTSQTVLASFHWCNV